MHTTRRGFWGLVLIFIRFYTIGSLSLWVEALLFRHKLQVDLGDLQSEKGHLSSFLESKLKVAVNQVGDKLAVDSEQLSVQELHRVVTKFVYHRNFNNTHWVSVKESTVKINRFKGIGKKKEKHKKHAPPHQTAIQSWEL